MLDSAFADARREPRDSVFALNRRTLNELLALIILGPVLQADLRCSYVPWIYAMDASPTGAGLCAAPVPASVVGELWRHTEQKEYYTRLDSTDSAMLREFGLDASDPSTPAAAVAPTSYQASLPRPVQEGILFDVLEVVAGSRHRTLAHQGTHPGVEKFATGCWSMDLDDANYHELVALACRRVVRDWHFGPPCLTFGTLRRPWIRSKAFACGFKPKHAFTRMHSRMAWRTAFLCCILLRLGLFFSVEQPGFSVMFSLHCFKVLVALGAVVTRFCSCTFASPFMKPLQWLHNKPLRGGCECS